MLLHVFQRLGQLLARPNRVHDHHFVATRVGLLTEFLSLLLFEVIQLTSQSRLDAVL